MAIVSATEFYKGRNGNSSSGGEKYVRVFHVVVDNVNTGAYSILKSGYVPFEGDPHNEDTNVLCSSVDCNVYQDDPLQWIVTANYGDDQNNELGGNAWGGGSQKPWLIPPKISFGHNVKSIVAERGYKVTSEYNEETWEFDPVVDDTLSDIKNSAGQPFDPPIMEEQYNLVIAIDRNERYVNPNTLHTIHGTVNKDKIKIAGVEIQPYEGLIKVEAHNAYEGKTEYWNVRYTIEIQVKKFIHEINDMGYYELDENELDLVRIKVSAKDSDGNYTEQDCIEPVALNGSGNKADYSDGNGLLLEKLRWVTKEASSWSELSLPVSERQGDKSDRIDDIGV